ncbi:S10 family serine carboxypeptidase-like protein [Phyllobacterium bourgognense]|uniref:Carboxypeptidase C (Cathepsin A) n=1 Tax=Phyllobacterium bourgognense TaxID=314236 RepID=A0A368Z546_9HYPH|nr:hypothetical protein [Phyllobacterium bourgognense]RCW86367.1 carboxypeptidase C (cathepsin A) [Phyllobacterium bourgognense]
MNFRHLLLAAALGLSACNGSDSSTTKKEADSTFSDLANAKAELVKVNAQKEAGEKDKIVLAGEIAALEAKQKELRSAIGNATAELGRLQGEDGKGGEIAAQKARLAQLTSETEDKTADIKAAKETLARLGSVEDKSSEIGLAKAAYDKLVRDAEVKAEDLKKATETLKRLAGGESEGGEGGEIKVAKETLANLGKKIGDANKDLNTAKASLATLNGKDEGSIFAAQEKLKKLTGDGADPGEIARATKERDNLQEAARKANDDLVAARQKLTALQGDEGKGGEIAEAERKLLEVKDEIATTSEMLKAARESLEKLQGKDGSDGDIATARKALETLSADIETAQDKLAAAHNAWKKLAGEDGKSGDIAAEQKKLDDLIKLAGDRAEEIKVAQADLERITLDGKTITDKATLDAARIRSQAAFDAGRFDDAGKFLTDVGLNDEAIELYKKAGKIDKAAALLTAAGKLEDAYKLYAVEDEAITDTNPYGAATYGSVTFDKVDESPSVKRHSMQLGDKTVWFTAKAGHLVAYAQKDKNNPDAKRDPQAAVFYMSYTRDDLPKEGRPVTFFFNGGPGESSIWLHLGAWAPWRLKVDQPNVPADAKSGPPKSYPFVENPETLLDKTDLVFVDPIGAGYSQAISSDVKKHINKDFWGVDADAKVMRDFITRYINVNKRQSSPKYLYGESYGGGIRVPVLAKLLIDAGTTNFDDDKSGKPPVVLTGSTLHSPILDYGSNCSTGGGSSCAGYIPTYVLTSDFFGKSTGHDKTRPYTKFVEQLRSFTREEYTPAITEYLKVERGAQWTTYTQTFLDEMSRLTGITATRLSDSKGNVTNYANIWRQWPTVTVGKCEPDRKQQEGYMNALKPGFSYNLYDTRMVLESSVPYDFEYSEDDAFKARMATFVPEYLNYKNSAEYIASPNLTNKDLSKGWDWGTNRGGVEKKKTSSLSDLALAINGAPGLKLIVTHGYFDAATPFFQTELDLDVVVNVHGADVKLSDRIPVHNFEGGHMIYYVEKARPALKRTMDNFYDAPPYTPPATVPARKSAALQ